MKHLYSRWSSLRAKIVLPYLLLALLLAIVAAFIGTRLVFDSVEERFVNQLIEVGKLSATWMVDEENRLLRTLRLVARAQGIADHIIAQDAEALRQLAYPIAVNAREEAVVILDTNGVTLLAMYHQTDGKIEEYNFWRGDETFKSVSFVQQTLHGVVDEQGDKFAGIIQDTRGSYLYVAGPIYDDANHVIGVVLVGKSFGTLARQLREATLAQVAMYDLQGVGIATTLAGTPALDAATLNHLSAGNQLLRRRFQVAEIPYRQIISPLRVRERQTIGFAGLAFAENFLVRIGQNTWLQILIAVIVALVLVVLIGFFISNLISMPILQLERAASRVASGDLAVHVEPTGNDEVTSLTRQFNMMVANLYRSQNDLIRAYDSTLEGWVKALDLRDRETKGHSERVTELTLALARRLNIDPREMEHLRRGALLHDIGKMAIPDDILQKPSALTNEEWQIMRQHPIYAKEMVQDIPFLQPALDIPYCHHEHWDGTGYPRGLKGEDIPLVARIFAVVDAWDALCSDRPYRQALAEAQAREALRQAAGTHLDPKIVQVFLQMLDEEKPMGS